MWYKRTAAILGFAVLVALFYFPTTREVLKITVLLGMPALVIWSYWRRLKRNSLSWWALLVVMVGLAVLYGFLMQDLPGKVAVKQISEQGGVYLSQGEYHKAIDKYRELGKYGKENKMRDKINGVYEAEYSKASELADKGRYGEARRLLKEIPKTAPVYPKARRLLDNLGEK